MKKLFFVYNPYSGKGRINQNIEEIKEILRSQYEVTVYETKFPRDAIIQVSENAEKYDRIVCAGGDGTLSEAVSGMMKLPKEKRVPIGFIPAGSTNDTAKSYNIPSDIKEAAKVAATGEPMAIDVGIFNKSRYITYVASFGELSAVSCFTPQKLKEILGHLAYIEEGIRTLLHLDYHNVLIEYKDENGKSSSLKGEFYLGMSANTYSVGGFRNILGDKVSLNDGLYETVVLSKPNNIIGFAEQVDAVVLKKNKNTTNELVHNFKSKHIKFVSEDELQWVIDGENAGKYKEVEIDVEKEAVYIVTPK